MEIRLKKNFLNVNIVMLFIKNHFLKKEEQKFYKQEFEKFMSSRAGEDSGWLNATKHIQANYLTFKRRYNF